MAVAISQLCRHHFRLIVAKRKSLYVWSVLSVTVSLVRDASVWVHNYCLGVHAHGQWEWFAIFVRSDNRQGLAEFDALPAGQIPRLKIILIPACVVGFGFEELLFV